MSMKELERFQSDLSNNESLRSAMKAAGGDVGAQIAAANAQGYGFSKSDIDQVSSPELSDQALDKVAGGIVGIGTGNKYVLVGGANFFINW